MNVAARILEMLLLGVFRMFLNVDTFSPGGAAF